MPQTLIVRSVNCCGERCDVLVMGPSWLRGSSYCVPVTSPHEQRNKFTPSTQARAFRPLRIRSASVLGSWRLLQGTLATFFHLSARLACVKTLSLIIATAPQLVHTCARKDQESSITDVPPHIPFFSCDSRLAIASYQICDGITTNGSQ